MLCHYCVMQGVDELLEISQIILKDISPINVFELHYTWYLFSNYITVGAYVLNYFLQASFLH